MSALTERLRAGPVLCAQGYVFELERRGYLTAGPYVPETVLDHPEVVEQLHRDFVHAGSDVVEALTYYAHREKLRSVGREGCLEALNVTALEIAGRVARDHGSLFAGNISNTNIYDPAERGVQRQIQSMFDDQVGWAADAGVDFVIAETLSWQGEALLALQSILRAALPAVVTLAVPESGRMLDGDPVEACCKRLQDAGATVVGLNCFRGPKTMLPLVRRVREAVSCPVAALPVPYRTSEAHPTFFSLRDSQCPCQALPQGRAFPTALEPFTCTRYEMADMATAARAMGVDYIGICCGAGPHHVRAMAEALGREPPASRYSPDLRAHS